MTGKSTSEEGPFEGHTAPVGITRAMTSREQNTTRTTDETIETITEIASGNHVDITTGMTGNTQENIGNRRIITTDTETTGVTSPIITEALNTTAHGKINLTRHLQKPTGFDWHQEIE